MAHLYVVLQGVLMRLKSVVEMLWDGLVHYERDRAVEEQQLSRMASICSSVWGGTEGPSMFLTTLWELDSMRWREGPASCCGISALNLPENAKTGRLTTGASFSSEIRADSHWARVIDVKESEEAECG